MEVVHRRLMWDKGGWAEVEVVQRSEEEQERLSRGGGGAEE